MTLSGPVHAFKLYENSKISKKGIFFPKILLKCSNLGWKFIIIGNNFKIGEHLSYTVDQDQELSDCADFFLIRHFISKGNNLGGSGNDL